MSKTIFDIWLDKENQEDMKHPELYEYCKKAYYGGLAQGTLEAEGQQTAENARLKELLGEILHIVECQQGKSLGFIATIIEKIKNEIGE